MYVSVVVIVVVEDPTPHHHSPLLGPPLADPTPLPGLHENVIDGWGTRPLR